MQESLYYQEFCSIVNQKIVVLRSLDRILRHKSNELRCFTRPSKTERIVGNPFERAGGRRPATLSGHTSVSKRLNGLKLAMQLPSDE